MLSEQALDVLCAIGCLVYGIIIAVIVLKNI